MSPSSSQSGGSRLRRLLALTAVAATAAGGSAVLSAGASAAEQPWGFEQVTPVEKGEGTVGAFDGFRAAQDGNTFLYNAKSPFSSVPTESAPYYTRYLGTRGEHGWTSRGIVPPMGVPTYNSFNGVLATSENLHYALVASILALTPDATAGGGNLYLRDTRTLEYVLVATSPDPRLARAASNPFGQAAFPYVANDGRGVLFSTSVSLDPGFDGDTIYQWRADAGVRIVSVLPDGSKVTAQGVNPSDVGARDPMPRDLGALDHIYFAHRTVNPDPEGAYVRTGEVTRVVSRSRLPGAPSTAQPADVLTVGTGGKVAVISSPLMQRLTPDTPAYPPGSDSLLYRYDYDTDSLTFIAPAAAYGPVQHMTGDGMTIAFVSPHALRPGAVDGQQNLYVWRNGTMRFVQTGGAVGGSTGLRLLSPNGRYLAYTDDTPSVAQRFGVDNVSAACPLPYSTAPGGCSQVYVFDADAASDAEGLSCASCREDRSTPAGHSGDPWDIAGSAIGFMGTDQRQPQTVTDDGFVFFTSADDLVPGDANGKADVYRYRDGVQRLLSRATPNTRARFLDATRDGSAVFFSTDDRIVPTDIDRSVDIYMTRLGAGYPYDEAEAGSVACSGTDCRDKSALPGAPPPTAGTVTFDGAGNPPAGAGAPKPSKATVRRLKAVRGTRAVLRVSVNQAGRVQVHGNLLRAGTAVARSASTVRVPVRLSGIGVRTLERERTLRLRVSVRFIPKAGDERTLRVPVTFKLASTKKGR